MVRKRGGQSLNSPLSTSTYNLRKKGQQQPVSLADPHWWIYRSTPPHLQAVGEDVVVGGDL